MAGPIFITGATGFIGTQLVRRLLEQGHTIRALSRRGGDQDGPLTWVRGRLEARDTYAHALEGCEAVVHLGALTGKAKAADFKRSNVDGTRALIAAARTAGVRRFLFISTIATRYPELERYPYAKSKLEAEALVKESELDWTIMRPTIVLGPGSPILKSLAALAKLPVTPIFGSGQVEVQPIMVDDVTRSIAHWLFAPDQTYSAQEIDLGGAETLTFEHLMQRIRQAQGKRAGRVFGLPLKSTMWGLGMVDPALGAKLPVTAGQLYAFRYDSTAKPSAFMSELEPSLMPLSQALSRSFEDAVQIQSREALEKECKDLSRYLIGRAPSELVVRAYVQAHELGSLTQPEGADGYDRLLLNMGRRGGVLAKSADVHARFFANTGVLRRKLVLLLAILETDAEGRAAADSVSQEHLLSFIAKLGVSGVSSVALLALGLPVLLPARAVLRKEESKR